MNKELVLQHDGGMEMKRGNVLVLGNSGVGKSTLINAVLGDRVARTGYGTVGTTKHLEIFENNEINFRIIDSVGFEPGFFKRRRAIDAVRDWSKTAAKAGDENTAINVIWFCVDGTSRKLFPEAIDSLAKASSIFKTVPIITVITKSYSIPDRETNIRMVQNAFNARTGRKLNLVKIIPVVAEIYNLNDTAFAPQEGITELIDATYEVMPEGIQAAAYDIDNYKLKMKQSVARGISAASTAAGVAVGATTIIPYSDAVVLTGIESAEIKAIASVYGIKKSKGSTALIQKIVEIGTVSMVARATCSAVLRIIPVAGQIANAVVAGCFVAAIGEGSRYVFEQIYLGNKSVEDLEWVEKMVTDAVSKGVLNKAEKAKSQLNENTSKEDVVNILK